MNNQRFSGLNRCQLHKNHKWKAYWTKELVRGLGEKSILKTWSNGRDIQLKMSVGRMKKRFRSMDRPYKNSWTGVHENFQAREYDAGPLPTTSERRGRRQLGWAQCIFAHLRKERFPRGTYNKLKMKKIGPCRIIRRFGTNAYEIELFDGIGISPIFNILYLYPYRDEEEGAENEHT